MKEKLRMGSLMGWVDLSGLLGTLKPSGRMVKSMVTVSNI